MESLVADFRGTSHAWARREPLAAPPAVWVADAGPHRRWLAPMRWAAVVAEALLLAAIPLCRDYSQRQAAARAAADTQLLEAVSADISRSAPEPLELPSSSWFRNLQQERLNEAQKRTIGSMLVRGRGGLRAAGPGRRSAGPGA